MFIISLSDYNQTLWEDDNTNRMLEAEKLFGEMLNNVFFRNTPFIVFFNKLDLFKEKLKKVSLEVAYKEYSLPKEAETDPAKEKHALWVTSEVRSLLNFVSSRDFVTTQFKSRNLNPDRKIYDFETTATDTDLVNNVMTAVQTIIFKDILRMLL